MTLFMNCTCRVTPCDFEANVYSLIALRRNQTFFIKGEQQEAFHGLVVNHFDIFFKINADGEADEKSEAKADAKKAKADKPAADAKPAAK